MANSITITGLINALFVARDQVARELAGGLTAIGINGGSQRAAKGTTVTSMRTSQPTVGTSITPAMTPPDTDDYAYGSDSMTLDKEVLVNIGEFGEEARALDLAGGPGSDQALEQWLKQGIRSLANKVSTDLNLTVYKGGSRAVGTAGTTPFASNMNILASLARVLDDNGCPDDGQRCLTLSPAAIEALRQLTQNQDVNTAGNADVLERGAVPPRLGFILKQDKFVASHTKGTAAGYLTDLVAGYAIGDRTIHVDTGTGTILEGDVVSFADDPSAGAYVVNTGFAGDGDGDIVLNHPGLTGAVINNKAVSLAANYTANWACHKSAVELAMRPPLVPSRGDLAIARQDIVDPVTGLTFQMSVYPGYRMNRIELTARYGIKVWKPEFVALLLG